MRQMSACLIFVLTSASLAGCTQKAAQASPPAPAASTSIAAPAKAAITSLLSTTFSPPAESAIPAGPLGDVIRQGRNIFVDTPTYAKAYVGNSLSCTNCHLDAGRQANSAPLWGAYGMYPQYRQKNGKVNTFGERLQDCFKFSLNGKAPPLDSAEMVALQTYAWWLSKGAPVGERLAGAGYPKHNFKPPLPPDYARGEKVFKTSCALCHGENGQGQQVAGRNVFPPLWGPKSFNRDAGMGQLDNAAAFIKANMPFSRGDTLSDQDAWDVAMYMDAHERPHDLRLKGAAKATRKQQQDKTMSLYGKRVSGYLPGSPGSVR